MPPKDRRIKHTNGRSAQTATAASTHLAQAGGVGLAEGQRGPASRPLLPLALAQVAKRLRHAVRVEAEGRQGGHDGAQAGQPADGVGQVPSREPASGDE